MLDIWNLDLDPGVHTGDGPYSNSQIRVQKSGWHLLEFQEFLDHVVEDEEDKDHLEAQHHKVFKAHITEQLQQKRGYYCKSVDFCPAIFKFDRIFKLWPSTAKLT